MNGCCIVLGVQTSVCDLKTTRKILHIRAVFFPRAFYLFFWRVYCVFRAAFFRALFWCVFALLLRSAFLLFSHLSPRPTCCLDDFYTMPRCFDFVLCFFLCFSFFERQ